MAGVVGQTVFALAWLTVGVLQDEYRPRSQYISALAAGDAQYAWIMVPAFLAFGVSHILFAAGLHRGLGRGSSLGPILLALAGAGVIAAGIARNDCSNGGARCEALYAARGRSLSDLMHEPAAAVFFACLCIAPAVLSQRMARDGRWRDLRRWSLLTTPVLVVLLVEIATKMIAGWAGAAQRLFLLLVFAWVVLLALRLRSVELEERAKFAIIPQC